MASKRKAETASEETEAEMDMKQIIIFGLFVVPVLTNMQPCYKESELQEVAMRKLRRHYPQPLDPAPAAATDSPASCPVAQFPQQPSGDMSDRSLSPWRYVHVTMQDHFPSTYSEAQCLCSGCILIQDNKPPVESHDYASHTIKQSRVFLKRELCENSTEAKEYYLTPVTVEVAVGCTCLRPRISS